MIGALTYGTRTIQYEVRFLASRRTLTIEVHPDCRVLVRAPLDCPKAVIAERVQKRAGWISRQLAEFERYRPRTPARQCISGESHVYLGRQYRLKLVPGGLANVKLTRGQLLLHGPHGLEPQRVREILQRWYLDRARAVFSEVLQESVMHVNGIDYPRLIVRAMQTRWGSMSRAGTMTLNASLVRAPRNCIEYVVMHELCHLKYRNHDARFFRLLGQLMPDWEVRKRRLETALL